MSTAKVHAKDDGGSNPHNSISDGGKCCILNVESMGFAGGLGGMCL